MKTASRLASCVLAVALGFLALDVASTLSRSSAGSPNPVTAPEEEVPCCCKATFTLTAAGASCNCGIAVQNLQVLSLHCTPYAPVGGSCDEISENSCTATGQWAESGCGIQSWTDFSLTAADCGPPADTDTKACSSGSGNHGVKLECNQYCVPFDCD